MIKSTFELFRIFFSEKKNLWKKEQTKSGKILNILNDSMFLGKCSVFESLSPHPPLFRWHMTGWGNVYHPHDGLRWALIQQIWLLPDFCGVRLLCSASCTCSCELAFGDSPMELQLSPEKGFIFPHLLRDPLIGLHVPLVLCSIC